MLSKSANGLSGSSTYSAVLENSSDVAVGAPRGALSASDTAWQDSAGNLTAAVRLTGTINLEAAAKTEGVYKLVITALTGSVSKTQVINISALEPTKAYGISCYPRLSATGISGYLYSPNISTLNTGKFSYVVKDLNGNIIQSLTPTVLQSNSVQWNISAVFSTSIVPGYYSVELKYDGKSLYNFDDPAELLQSGYSLYYSIAAKPEMKSYSTNSSGECYGYSIDEGGTTGLVVTAFVYDNSDATKFAPVATLTMAKNQSTGLYEFTSLTGIESGKEYDLELVDGHGISISSLSDIMLGNAPNAVKITVSVNGTDVVFNTNNTAACNAIAAVYSGSGKMLGVGTASISQSQETANVGVNVASLPVGYSIKLFLLDSGSKPICDYYTHT